jgi:hypothetical protein
MDRDVRSPRTEIERYIISMDRCYLHGQRCEIPADRDREIYNLHGQMLSPWTERWNPHGHKYRET